MNESITGKPEKDRLITAIAA